MSEGVGQRRPQARLQPVLGLLAVLGCGLAAGLLPWFWLVGGLVALAALAEPALALGLLVLSVTAQDLVHLPGGLTLTQAASGLALVSWLAALLAHPTRRLPFGWTLAGWAALLAALLLATSLSQYAPNEGLKELWRWSVALLAWLMATTVLHTRWQCLLVLGGLLAGPLLNAGIGLVQFGTGDGPPAFHIAANLVYVRAYGTLGQPNSFAGYMNMAWPLALALAISTTVGFVRQLGSADSRHGVYRQAVLACWLWCGLGLLLAALVASFSRGAWLGAAIGLLGMLVVSGRTGRRGGLVVVALLVGVGLLGQLQLLPSALSTRLASIAGSLSLFDPRTVLVTPANFAVVERMAQVWAGWQMFVTHPLVGVGPGAYTAAYQQYALPPWFASRGHAHNYYLHMAAEAGVIGLLAYVGLLVAVVADLRVAFVRVTGLHQRAILVGICGMIAAMVGHNLFENLHVLHLSVHMAAAWGLAIALVHTPEGT